MTKLFLSGIFVKINRFLLPRLFSRGRRNDLVLGGVWSATSGKPIFRAWLFVADTNPLFSWPFRPLTQEGGEICQILPEICNKLDFRQLYSLRKNFFMY